MQSMVADANGFPTLAKPTENGMKIMTNYIFDFKKLYFRTFLLISKLFVYSFKLINCVMIVNVMTKNILLYCFNNKVINDLDIIKNKNC